jgi:hypothetical protein
MGLKGGECPQCAAHSVIRMYEVREGDPEPPDVGPCPGCGKMPTGITTIIVMLPKDNGGRNDDEDMEASA